ncbi:hypothetical protein DFJ43DRAFT_1142233 [Lentinula guzmanii]|uniref:Uncharacterized protein n=1 Tax=Lentinula guzmanii TaxID=2804957 RepID=A0AA38MUX3_9AGAR|nr:hypothetical protein DFJ43DRAFT_1142233 [Lentinula guzmanii]
MVAPIMVPVFVEKLVLEANDGVREGLMTGVELVTSEDVKVGRVVEGEGAVLELEDRVMVRDEDDISEEVSAVEGDVIVEEALMDDDGAKVEIELVEVVMGEEKVLIDLESVDAVEDKVDVGTSVGGGELLNVVDNDVEVVLDEELMNVVDRMFDEESEDEVEVDIDVDLVEDGIGGAEVEIEVGFKLVREVNNDVEVEAVDVDVLVKFEPDVLADTLVLVELEVVAATSEELAGH